MGDMSTHDLAVAQLNALVVIPGALRIITSEIKPELRQDPDDIRSRVREDAEAEDPDILKRVHTYVLHNVVRIEEPEDDRLIYSAWSDEGDSCAGRPEALLTRLQEWRA